MHSLVFIDDDPLLVRIVADKLKKRQLFTATDVAGCKEILDAGHQPDWIITDYFLENNETALDILELAKKYPLENTHIVCITANPNLKEFDSCRGKFHNIIEKATPQFFDFIENLR